MPRIAHEHTWARRTTFGSPDTHFECTHPECSASNTTYHSHQWVEETSICSAEMELHCAVCGLVRQETRQIPQ